MEPDPQPVQVNLDSPKSSSAFRRRLALLALLQNAAIVVALLLRGTDLGPNITELAGWVVIANALTVLGAVGSKAWETISFLKGRRP